MVTTISFIFEINKNTTKAIPKHPRRNYREYCFHSLLVTGSQKGWCANVGQYDEKYLRKCHKRLRELGAPLKTGAAQKLKMVRLLTSSVNCVAVTVSDSSM